MPRRNHSCLCSPPSNRIRGRCHGQAAIRLQALHRGRMARGEVAQLAEVQALQEEAAVKLQALQRGLVESATACFRPSVCPESSLGLPWQSPQPCRTLLCSAL